VMGCVSSSLIRQYPERVAGRPLIDRSLEGTRDPVSAAAAAAAATATKQAKSVQDRAVDAQPMVDELQEVTVARQRRVPLTTLRHPSSYGFHLLIHTYVTRNRPTQPLTQPSLSLQPF
jgi:hypothetical protein